MPRFHFHLHHPDNAIYDAEGMKFSSLKEAEEEARKAIRELAIDGFRKDVPFTVLSICITDTDGNPVSIVLSQHVLTGVTPPKIMIFGDRPTTSLQ
jgi:uncharacterized protein YnzC (UPF0291/DUF896 family)